MADERSINERLLNEYADGTADLSQFPTPVGIPAPSEDVAALLRSVRALKTAVDAMRGMGGSVLDKMLTPRDILTGGFSASGSGTTFVVGGGSSGGGSSGYTDPRPAPTTPPTPSNLTATGTFRSVMLTWDVPYVSNFAYAEVWRYTANNLAACIANSGNHIGNSTGAVFTDAAATNGTTYWYWARFVDTSNVTGSYSSGASAGAGLINGVDMTSLTITSSQLASNAVTADKASLDIGGQNLCANNSFEVDSNADGAADYWTGYTNSEAVTLTLQTGRISGYCQRVAWSGTNSTTKGVFPTSAVPGGWVSGKTYMISWYARASAAASTGMNIYWNTPPSSQSMTVNPNLTTSWQRYACRITWGASVETLGRFFASITNGYAATGYIEFDDVQIEEGDTLSGYFGKLATNTIVAGDGAISNAAITNALIANLAVDNAKIADATIQTAKIGDAQITNVKVSSGLDAAKITVGTLSATVIGSGSITSDKIDSKNLTIKDGSGNVIFGASATVSAASYLVPSSGWLNSNVGASNMLWGPSPYIANTDANGPWAVAGGSYGFTFFALKSNTTNPFGLQPGDTLTVSADVWQDATSAAAGQNATVYLFCTDSVGGWTAAATANSTATSATRVSSSVTLPVAASMYNVHIGLWHQGGTGTNVGVVNADRIQVERGSTATQYKPGAQPNATKNTVTYASTAPSSPTDGDIWVDTSGYYSVTKVRVSGGWQLGATDGASWGVNLLGRPTELTDGRISTAISSAGVVVSGVKPGVVVSPGGIAGLYLGSDYLGYYNGSAWRTYMDNSGNFYLGGSSGALQWNGSTLTINGGGTFSGALSAATGSFGALTVAPGGSIRQGQTAFDTGTGFWLGDASGTPKFSIGNASGQKMTWDGSNLVFDTLTVSVSGSSGSYSASVSGGRSSYTYQWFCVPTSFTGSTPGLPYLSGSTTSSMSMSMPVTGNAYTFNFNIVCLVKDANGRTAFATHASSYTSDGFIVGGGD